MTVIAIPNRSGEVLIWIGDRSRRLLRGPQIASERVGFASAEMSRGVHRPNPSQLLQGLLVRAGGEQDRLPCGLLVGKDRGEITVAEPLGVSAPLERLLDLLGAVELYEIDRLARLAPHALRARSSGL